MPLKKSMTRKHFVPLKLNLLSSMTAVSTHFPEYSAKHIIAALSGSLFVCCSALAADKDEDYGAQASSIVRSMSYSEILPDSSSTAVSIDPEEVVNSSDKAAESFDLSREKALYYGSSAAAQQTDNTDSADQAAASCQARDELNFSVVRCKPDAAEQNSCLITHDFNAALISYTDLGQMSWNLCSGEEGCLEFWFGNRQDNSILGSCTIYTETMQFKVINPAAVKRLIVAEAVYDDYIELSSGHDADKLKVDLLLPDGKSFPPETSGKCELGRDNDDFPETDIWSSVSAGVSPDEPVEVYLKKRLSVTGAGEGYFRFRLYFDPKKVLMQDDWGGLSCLKQFTGSTDNLLSECLTPIDSTYAGWNGMADILGTNSFMLPAEYRLFQSFIDPLCHDNLISSVIADNRDAEDSDSCKAILNTYPYCESSGYKSGYMEYRCADSMPCVGSFDENPLDEHSSSTDQLCSVSTVYTKETQAESAVEQVCAVMTDENGAVSSSCIDYQDACTLLDASCMDEENSSSGCTDMVYRYSCPISAGSPHTIAAKTISCPAMAGNLENSIEEDAADLTEAAVYLYALNSMQDDVVCTDNDGKSNSCSLFKGEERTCREGYAGKMACCTDPGITDLNSYLRLTAYMSGLKTALGTVSSSTASFGSWASQKALSSGQGLISSAFDSVAASMGTDTTVALQAGTAQSIMTSLAGWTEEAFGTEFKDILFTETEAEGGMAHLEINPAITNTASGIMAAYVAYKAAALLVEIVTSCRESEIETSMQIGLKACSYAYSSCTVNVLGHCLVHERHYCCYSSSLGRIIMTQLRADGFQENECGGIPLNKLDQVDFSSLDLSEWEAELSEAGLLSDGSMNTSLESLTGAGSVLDTTGNRPDAAERTKDRLRSTLGGE